MSDFSIFGIHENNRGVYSSYIPFISFATQEHKGIAESYVIREADVFFKSILKIEDSVQLVPYLETITLKDFNQVEMEYFYNTLFFDLGERDINGRLINKLKWSVAFDEEMTPIQVAYLSPSFSGNSGEARLSYSDRREGRPYFSYRPQKLFLDYRKYGFISVNGEPVFYYLHFTLQEILDTLKQPSENRF
ncbi:hypothetical protein [Oscillatoria sp. FACHB-1406]|uniref:hypothetical protein n=1 Tax=Oscillatoria sp. FACHB-1406 TaxID=2692846 RepID=UPI001688B489|nr:hypothetical protein [Oscillatoria sp. FACHB-1406]MBD2578254.1 hypothetical protein [Oscillatoria sp. FACHB-1406]